MPSYDMKVFNNRAREIRRAVRLSSPALVYSGPLGIALIAELRPGTKWRIGKVMDRMAIISRGDTIAGDIVHHIANLEAYGKANSFSRGGVLGKEPAYAVGAALRERNGRYALGSALPVEACFVQLNATPNDDYLAYLSVDGAVQTFRTAWFLGEATTSEKASSAQREQATLALNDRLATALGPYHRFSDLWEALAGPGIPDKISSLRNSPSLDVVVLNRASYEKRDFGGIFQRLAL